MDRLPREEESVGPGSPECADGSVTGLLEVGAEGVHQPEGAVTVWLFIHRIPTAQCQSGRELMPERLQQNGTGAWRIEG